MACLLDRNNDGNFEALKVAPGAIWFEKNLDSPLPYKKIVLGGQPVVMPEVVAPADDSFKYEILYQGVSRNTLKLAYREYIKDMARPAFYQDVTYDLEVKPTTISFRTVRIEISAADNNKITYRVLSSF